MTDHRHIHDRIDDYLDGAIPEEERLMIARHLEVCPSCREEFEAMKSLLEKAKDLPDSLTPRRDLWPAIKAQVRPEHVPETGAPIWIMRILQPKWGFGAALAAAAVIAIVLLGPPEESTKQGTSESPEARPVMPSHVSSLVQALEYECMGAGKQLLASVGGSDNRFGIEAATAIEQSVHPIDAAIEETKSALERNPGDPELLQILTSRYQRKLSLLHQAIRLVGKA
jgi:hypothetical protein